MQDTIESNKQDYDEKMKKLASDLTGMIASMMDQINIYKSSPYSKGSPKTHDPTTEVAANKKAPPLEGGHYTKNGGIWNIKNEISSPKFYELLIKTELKGYTAM